MIIWSSDQITADQYTKYWKINGTALLVVQNWYLKIRSKLQERLRCLQATFLQTQLPARASSLLACFNVACYPAGVPAIYIWLLISTIRTHKLNFHAYNYQIWASYQVEGAWYVKSDVKGNKLYWAGKATPKPAVVLTNPPRLYQPITVSHFQFS